MLVTERVHHPVVTTHPSLWLAWLLHRNNRRCEPCHEVWWSSSHPTHADLVLDVLLDILRDCWRDSPRRLWPWNHYILLQLNRNWAKLRTPIWSRPEQMLVLVDQCPQLCLLLLRSFYLCRQHDVVRHVMPPWLFPVGQLILLQLGVGVQLLIAV